MPTPLRFAIVILVFAAMATVAVLGYRFIQNPANIRNIMARMKKGNATTQTVSAGGKSTQEMLPLANLIGPTIVQKDGTAVAYVKVTCKNYSLLSTEEKVREAERTSIVLGSQPNKPLKILHVQRPVDSTENLLHLRAIHDTRSREMAETADEGKRKSLRCRNAMLEHLMADERSNMKGMTRTRSDAYIALPVEKGVANEEAAYRQRAMDMATTLRDNGFQAKILHGNDIVRMLLDCSGSYRTETENADPYATTPQFAAMKRQRKVEDTDDLF